jgi:hypothetical protein
MVYPADRAVLTENVVANAAGGATVITGDVSQTGDRVTVDIMTVRIAPAADNIESKETVTAEINPGTVFLEERALTSETINCFIEEP